MWEFEVIRKTAENIFFIVLTQKRTHICLRQVWALFNEINPLRDLWNNASRYEIADAMKYAAAYEGFILFHIATEGSDIS